MHHCCAVRASMIMQAHALWYNVSPDSPITICKDSSGKICV